MGNDHTDDGSLDCIRGRQPCKVRELLEDEIDEKIKITAAAGNSGNDQHLVCPGRSEEAITVSGFKPECTAEISEKSIRPSPSMDIRPPNACWVETDAGNMTDILCSGEQCSPFHSCKNNRREVPADTNLPPVDNKPDILAPSVLFAGSGPEKTLVKGSSWAVPFVTASVAECMALIREYGGETTRSQVKRAIEATARPLDDGTERMFYGIGMFEKIAQEAGFDIDASPPDFIEENNYWWG